MPTPHNSAAKGEIKPRVLMPGDPLRARFIAETYLDNVTCFNEVRGMLGYSGTYQGEPVSVMGSGMGGPSIAIYSYELFHFYDVEAIIRLGSAGAMQDRLRLNDMVIAMSACTDSSFQAQYQLPGTFAPTADFGLLRKAVVAAESKHKSHAIGTVLSSDVFYPLDRTANDKWRAMNVLCVEMETAALYMTAAASGRKALSLLTISDHLYTGEHLGAAERQTSFREMIEIGLSIPL
jgi:purine-nucleoside phosphorylase